MSGDYASKKILSHLLVPAVGRKVIDLGEDLEKGLFLPIQHRTDSEVISSANV